MQRRKPAPVATWWKRKTVCGCVVKAADSDDRIAQSARPLASVYDEEGEYSESLALCRQVLETDKKLQGEKSRAYGNDLNSLGLVSQHASKYAEAQQAFQQAIAVFEQDGQSMELAATLLIGCQLMQETARYDQVEPLFKRALAIYDKAGTKLEMAQCISLLATFCRVQSRYSEAEALLNRALTIRQSALEKLRQRLATRLPISAACSAPKETTPGLNRAAPRLEHHGTAGADRQDVADIATYPAHFCTNKSTTMTPSSFTRALQLPEEIRQRQRQSGGSAAQSGAELHRTRRIRQSRNQSRAGVAG